MLLLRLLILLLEKQLKLLMYSVTWKQKRPLLMLLELHSPEHHRVILIQ